MLPGRRESERQRNSNNPGGPGLDGGDRRTGPDKRGQGEQHFFFIQHLKACLTILLILLLLTIVLFRLNIGKYAYSHHFFYELLKIYLFK